VQQAGTEFCERNIVAGKMYNVKSTKNILQLIRK